jgi:hypothetical protein
VASVVRRLVLVLTVIVAFTALQTGWACAYDCGDDEHADDAPQACSEVDEEGPCAPTCVDCTGCGGPARALIAHRDPAPMGACLSVVLGTPVVERSLERAPDRIDRPPRD